MNNSKEIDRIIALFGNAGALTLKASTPTWQANAIAVNQKSLLSYGEEGDCLGTVFITGLSGSGKSRFAHELSQALLDTTVFPIMVDLDEFSSEVDDKWSTNLSEVSAAVDKSVSELELGGKRRCYVHVVYGLTHNMVDLFSADGPLRSMRLMDIQYLIAPPLVYNASNWFKFCESVSMGAKKPLSWQKHWLDSSSLSGAEYLERVSHHFEMLTRVFKRHGLDLDPVFTPDFESETRGWF